MELTDQQRATIAEIRAKSDELLTLLDQLGTIDGEDFTEIRGGVLELRDTAARLAE